MEKLWVFDSCCDVFVDPEGEILRKVRFLYASLGASKTSVSKSFLFPLFESFRPSNGTY